MKLSILWEVMSVKEGAGKRGGAKQYGRKELRRARVGEAAENLGYS